MLDNGVEVYPATRFRDLIGEAHAVVIAAPLTAETEGMLGAAELAECREPRLANKAFINNQIHFHSLIVLVVVMKVLIH